MSLTYRVLPVFQIFIAVGFEEEIMLFFRNPAEFSRDKTPQIVEALAR